ncbi:hypothetical protein [Streptosporangium sp. NPDC002524]|uniref:hypothetical protein n=1 Tax=Streptosporangium sp. NPDC002524 TaxID=3154537 RepID=UPI00332B5A51
MTRERRTTPDTVHRDVWFPGRLIGGVALVAGPIVWFAGLLLRHLVLHSGIFTSEQLARFGEQPFAAPAQLAAYARDPALVTAGYAAFCAGAVLLLFAIVTFARVIATRCPGLASWGAGLFVLGLFSRLYFTGVEQTLFQLTGPLGLDRTTGLAMDLYVDISYGPWLVPVLCSAGAYPGTLLLAVGAYRSGTFGLVRCLLVLGWGTLWGGVLKESQLLDVVGAGLACLAFVPLGVRVLRGGPPDARTRTERAGRVPPRLLGSRFPGLWLLGSRLPGSRFLGSRFLGLRLLSSRFLGSRFLSSRFLSW